MVADNWVKTLIPAAMNTIPTSTNLPGPNLSVSRPAIGMVIIAPMPCGANSSPVASVVSPRTCRK